MAGLLDAQPQPYGLLGDIRQYTGLPSRAIGGLLDWYQSQPSVADRMASEYQGGLSAMDAAGQGLPERLKALAAYQRSIPVADSVAMDLGGMLGSIKAYHGSPHNFDRFDMSKIGTGEGAQAYGHGLYFAENEGVAQSYRQALQQVDLGPIDVVGVQPKDWNAARMFAQNMDPTLPEVAARDFVQWTGGRYQLTPELIDAFRQAKKPGSMYEVNINAKPEDFLDWDKKLLDQPGPRKAVNQLFQSGALDGQKKAASAAYAKPGFPEHLDTMDGQRVRDLLAAFRTPGQAYGFEGLPMLRGGTKAQSEAASLLRDAGVPGIKYLDYGSRAVGDGSRNYVVFDDSLIQILRKYGLLPPAIAGAGLLASPEDALAAP